jgi:hypothetical protein
VSPDSTAHDALMVSTPAVVCRTDGKYILIYKCVAKRRPLPFGGPVVHLAAVSDAPDGHFAKINEPLFLFEGDDFPVEDPYIWEQDGCYYAVLKDFKGIFTKAGRSLALFSSPDAIRWTPAENVLVSTLKVKMEDGSELSLERLERAQLFIEDGVPKALFCAAENSLETSFNIHIPLKP